MAYVSKTMCFRPNLLGDQYLLEKNNVQKKQVKCVKEYTYFAL